jgi:hypothetical protein
MLCQKWLYFLVALSLLIAVSACAPVAPEFPSTSTQIAEPSAIVESATITPATVEGQEVSVGLLNAVIPTVLGTGVTVVEFPRAEGEEVAPPEITPGHFVFTIEGYILQNKFHQPQIFIFPAREYAELVPAAGESIHRLEAILQGQIVSPNAEQLPFIPFFNAAQVFASNIQVVNFQNGSGIRFLTEYSQYAAPVNNHEIFYLFQGLTSDGSYYVVAILPITSSVLPETSDPAATIPDGGIPLPDINDVNADWQAYYSSVTAVLNELPPTAFSPTIEQLDLLINSIRVSQ